MKRVLIIALLALCLPLAAQSPVDIRQRLAQSEQNNTQVKVIENQSARDVLRRVATHRAEPTMVDGYRVGIFFDNGQSARSQAQLMVDSLERHFPNVEATMTYENPYFKVAAGYCLTNEEATMLLERLRYCFPKAYIMRERISIENLIIEPQVDSLEELSKTFGIPADSLRELGISVDSLSMLINFIGQDK